MSVFTCDFYNVCYSAVNHRIHSNRNRCLIFYRISKTNNCIDSGNVHQIFIIAYKQRSNRQNAVQTIAQNDIIDINDTL